MLHVAVSGFNLQCFQTNALKSRVATCNGFQKSLQLLQKVEQNYEATSGVLWQGSSTENWAKSLKLSRMTAGYFIDTKFGMVTHTVNSNLKPLLFFKKVTWLSIPGVKTIQIWPLNFGSKRQSEGYLQNLQKMALTAWDRVYFSNPTGSFENRYLLFLRGVIYHLLFTVVKINDPPGE